MIYSLWNTKIGHRHGRFETEEEALAYVRTLLSGYDRAKLADLSLNWRDEDGNVGEEITGEDLLRRAEEAAKKREPVKAGGDPYPRSSTNSSTGGGYNAWPIAASSKPGGKK